MVARRTQAERRATTRAALLDAAVASLVEDGYAHLTTRRVAERAGVSQGTQQHYFATKTEFVVEAMRHATREIAADTIRRVDFRRLLAEGGGQEELLDELWRVHRSPAFKAAVELLTAARTDPELRDAVADFERELTRLIGVAARDIVPDGPQYRHTMELLDVAMAAVRGYAMLASAVPEDLLERRWAFARRHLAEALRVTVAPPAR